MKQVYYIMKAELQSLFYSPVAWLILVVFSIQCAVSFCDTLDQVTKAIAEGMQMPGLTRWFFNRDWQGIGVFGTGMRYLYIYFPLLTMGLISREIANGSIKLLDSSPVSAVQVVTGKFLSMIVYSFVLIAVLMVFVVFGFFSIENFSCPVILVMLLGMILTMATYSAIGLFMSSLTRYPVVAAIGSFVVFFVLERIGNYGQSWDGVRDITSWLSLSGRTDAFLNGFLVSQNVIYFLGITTLFVCFTMLKLWLSHFHYSVWRQSSYYLGILVMVVGIGWLTSLPSLRFYWDVTPSEANTIAPESQAILKALKDKGKLTITTYVNLMDRYRNMGLPASVTGDKAGFDKYVRFKPDIEFKYVYYYAPTDLPHNIQRMKPNLTFEETAREIARLSRFIFNIFMTKEEIDRVVDLAPEHYRFVRFFELEDGTRSVLRIYDDIPPLPEEKEYMVAFKRLLGGMPVIGVVAGHGERSIWDGSNRGYERVASSVFNRYSWINQGMDTREVTLDSDVPDDVQVLVIADPKTNYPKEELERLDKYIAGGGNLILLVEPESHAVTHPLLERFGVELMPGCLAQKPNIELANVVETYITDKTSRFFDARQFSWGKIVVAMNGVAALQWNENMGYSVTPFMETFPDAWNKTGRVDWILGPIEADPERGERVGTRVTALALTRMVGGKEQRVFISGDADWLDNRELQPGGRQGFRSHSPARLNDMLSGWITDGVAPLKLSRLPETDTSVSVSQAGAVWARWCLVWGGPLLLVAIGCFVCIRRNRF